MIKISDYISALLNPLCWLAKTVTIVPGVHADFSMEGKLVGIEVIDASEIMGKKIEFTLPEVSRQMEKITTELDKF
jgi:uncharacterized protein YuzE